MRRAMLRWLCAGMLVGLGMGQAPAASAQQKSALSDVRQAFEPVTKDSFAQSFPQGKRSIVEQAVSGTGTLLTSAHRAALRRGHRRGDYRDAVVYQAAARRALDRERYAVAMYLTLHAREIGHAIIWANSTGASADEPHSELDLIQRAGGVDGDEVADYLRRAQKDVPAVELLFVED